MTSFRMISIPSFQNPVLQRPGGTEFTGQQVIPVREEINCIAIAADSHVDVVDIYPNGDSSPGKRFRVSAECPWFGSFKPGLDGIDSLIIVPVRAWDVTGDLPIGDNGPAEFPRLKLAVYGGGCMPPLTSARAPIVESWSLAEAPGISTNPNFYVPTSGRRLVSFTLRGNPGAGCLVVSATIYGIDSMVNSAGVFKSVLTVVKPLTAITSGLQFEYNGAPFGTMLVNLSRDAGVYGYDVLIDAHDS